MVSGTGDHRRAALSEAAENVRPELENRILCANL